MQEILNLIVSLNSIVPSWIAIFPTLLIGFGVYYLPGLLIGLLFGISKFAALALAPAISTGCYCLIMAFLIVTGFSINLITIISSLIILLTLFCAIAILRPSDYRIYWPDLRGLLKNLLILLPITIAILLSIAILSEPQYYSIDQYPDISFHNLYMKHIPDLRTLDELFSYQRGVHVVGFIIMAISGSPTYVIIHTLIAISTVGLTIGVIYLANYFFTKTTAIMVGGVLGLTLCIQFLLIGYRHLIPLHIGLAMIPAFLGFVPEVFRKGPITLRTFLSKPFLIIYIAALGTGVSHYNAGVALLLAISIIAVSSHAFPKYLSIPFLTLAITVQIALSYLTWNAEPHIRAQASPDILSALHDFFSGSGYLNFISAPVILVLSLLGCLRAMSQKLHWVYILFLTFLSLEIIDMVTPSDNSFLNLLNLTFNSSVFFQPHRLFHIVLVMILPALFMGFKSIFEFLTLVFKRKFIKLVVQYTLIFLIFLFPLQNFSRTQATKNWSFRGLQFPQSDANFVSSVQKTLPHQSYIYTIWRGQAFTLDYLMEFRTDWPSFHLFPFFWQQSTGNLSKLCTFQGLSPENQVYFWEVDNAYGYRHPYRMMWFLKPQIILSDGNNHLYTFDNQEFCHFSTNSPDFV